VRALRFEAVGLHLVYHERGFALIAYIDRTGATESTEGVDMVRQHRTTAAVVVTLALTAGFAPTASADPAPLARAEAIITATDSGTAVRANPDEQALGSQSHSATPTKVVITATDSGTAVRANPDEQALGSQSHSATPTNTQVKALADLQRAAVQAGLHPGVFGTNSPRVSTTAPTVARTTHSERGFDWGDAGIGAGGLLLLLAAGFAGTSAATSSRRRRPGEKRATAAR
jgi:hypothetical protein